MGFGYLLACSGVVYALMPGAYLDSRSVDYNNYRFMRSRMMWDTSMQYFSRLFNYASGLMTLQQNKMFDRRLEKILKWCQVPSLFELEMYLATNPDYLSYIYVKEKQMRVCGQDVWRKRKVTKYEIIGKLAELAFFVDDCVEKNRPGIPFVHVHQNQA